MNKEVAKLFLNGFYLTTTPSTLGVRSSDFLTYTFNVDMRTVLGETLYNNYDYFKMWYIAKQYGQDVALMTEYITGINLINTTEQGQPAGGKYPLSCYSQNPTPYTNLVIDRLESLQQYIMIKPNDNLIKLTISMIRNDAGYFALTNPYQFWFTFVPYEVNKIYKNPYNSIFTNEIRNFTLSTNILVAGSTNEFGTMASTYNTFTFTNINMRNIMGTLWDKYDKFNLVLASEGCGAYTTALSGAQRIQWWTIEGLQFINTLCYNSSIRSNQVATPQAMLDGTNTSSTQYHDMPQNIYTFRKPESENVSLSFQLYSLNGAPLTSGVANRSFTFCIIGINK
jgi:hypothetical protein